MQTLERSIRAGSLKALFAGNKIEDNPAIVKILNDKFHLNVFSPPRTYRFDTYLEMLEWLRQRLYSNEVPAIGYEKLGRSITQGVLQGAVGHLLRVSAGLLGVQGGLSLFFRVLGGALPFATIRTLEQKPGYVRFILFNVPGPPDVTRGMILESMDAAEAKNSVIKYQKPNENDTEFEVTWQV